MSQKSLWLMNYEAIDQSVPKFRKVQGGKVCQDDTKADITISGPGSPPDLPAAYRYDGSEHVKSDGSEFVGIPYNLADDPGKAELHTAWVQYKDGQIRFFLGSRMILIDLEGEGE